MKTNQAKIMYSIVIPCFNEKENIPLLLKRFSSCLDELDSTSNFNSSQFELILVDNGSSDGTFKDLKPLIAGFKFCTMIHTPDNLGYGGGIQFGLNQCRGNYIGWTHADLQTDPGDVFKAFQICSVHGSTNIFVKGRRRKRKIIDRFFSKGMSLFESFLFFAWYDDINAQPNIFTKDLYAESAFNAPKDFAYDLYIYYVAKRCRLK